MLTKFFSKWRKPKSGKGDIQIPSVEYQFSENDFNSGYFNGRSKIPPQQRTQHWPKVVLKDKS